MSAHPNVMRILSRPSSRLRNIAKAQLTYGKDSEMRELAQEIVHDQEGELDLMQRWLKQHDAGSWAPVKCRECHKKADKPE